MNSVFEAEGMESSQETEQARAKRMGRPKGSKNRLKHSEKLMLIEAQKLRDEVELLKEENARLNNGNFEQIERDNELLRIHVAELEHQIIGYRAVISYLEAQVGLRESQE